MLSGGREEGSYTAICYLSKKERKEEKEKRKKEEGRGEENTKQVISRQLPSPFSSSVFSKVSFLDIYY